MTEESADTHEIFNIEDAPEIYPFCLRDDRDEYCYVFSGCTCAHCQRDDDTLNRLAIQFANR